MLPEKQYYPAVEKFIQEKYNCIKTGINKGNLALGLVDIIGIYEISSEFYTDVEIIVTEVKTTTSSFGKLLGQALGYSIFGERCYLAITFEENKSFTQDQEFMANHLGVGLIRISVNKEYKPIKSKIDIILSSKKFDPILSLKQNLLFSNGIVKCSLCGIIGNSDDLYSITRKDVLPALFIKNNIRKIFLCKECYRCLIPESERLLRKAFVESGKKAAKTKKYQNAAKKAVQTRKERESKSGEN